MELCPICKSNKPNLPIKCLCGYDFGMEEITDPEKIRDYFVKIKRNKNWEKGVRLIKSIHEIQQSKYGVAKPGDTSGWSIENTAELLNRSKTIISDDIKLAFGIDEFPELLKKKKTQALKSLKSLNRYSIWKYYGKPFNTENEFQSYLETNWGKIELFKEWTLEEKQKNMGETGFLDILARHNSEPKWLIIELKKDLSSDKNVGQILRYMGWVKEKFASKNEEVFGLIIYGPPPDENIRLSLLSTKNLDHKLYYLYKDQIKFMDAEFAFKLCEIDKGSSENIIESLEKLYSDYNSITPICIT